MDKRQKIFDAHLHIIDSHFPLVANQGFLPAAFTIDDYLSKVSDFELVGGAVVSGSFQGFDQTYLLDALDKLGESYCGVANIPANVTDEELIALDTAGVRAVRFNLKRGGSADAVDLAYLSSRLFEEFGWHTELYLDSADIKSIAKSLKQLSLYSIDHLGLSKEGLAVLYELVESGALIKATGFGRLDFDPVPVMKQIMHINPESLMFGTDLPSTRAKLPFSMAHLDMILDTFSQKDQQRIFYENALKLYGKRSRSLEARKVQE